MCGKGPFSLASCFSVHSVLTPGLPDTVGTSLCTVLGSLCHVLDSLTFVQHLAPQCPPTAQSERLSFLELQCSPDSASRVFSDWPIFLLLIPLLGYLSGCVFPLFLRVSSTPSTLLLSLCKGLLFPSRPCPFVCKHSTY